MKEKIKFPDFEKVEIKMGKVIECEKVENTDKLLKLTLDIGGETRTILTGMAEFFEPDHFVGKTIPILANLEPRTIRGIESQGMVLAAESDGRPVLLLPEDDVLPGSEVR